MTLKMEDLRRIKAEMIRHGYLSQFPLVSLRNIVAEHYGISDYIQKNIIQKMVEFNLVKEAGIGIFEWVEKPKTIKEDIEDIDKRMEELTNDPKDA